MVNLKKFLALFVVIAMLAAFAIPAYAEDATPTIDPADLSAAQICEMIGMVIGTGNGVTAEYLETQPTRLQSAVMLLRLLGREQEALSFTGWDSNFSDAELVTWGAGRNILAYLYANPDIGYWGDGEGSFDPLSAITVKEYYKVCLMALGWIQDVDFSWENTLKFAATKGLRDALDFDPFTVNALCVATVEALTSFVANGSEALITYLVRVGAINSDAATATGIFAPPAPIVITEIEAVPDITVLVGGTVTLPTALIATFSNGTMDEVAVTWPAISTATAFPKTMFQGTIAGSTEKASVYITCNNTEFVVSSLTATSLKILTVLFNKPVDATTVVAANFLLNGAAAGKVELQSDGKTVLVWAAANPTANPAVYNVKVQNVKDTVGVVVTTFEKTGFQAFDSTVPTAISATLVAPAVFEILFSEPMATAGTITVNDGLYGIAAVAGPGGTYKVTVTLAMGLVYGTNYTVKISGAADFGGIAIAPTTLTLAYTNNAVAIDVALVSATQTYAYFTFNQVVAGVTAASFTQTYNASLTSPAYQATAVTTTDNKTFMVSFITNPCVIGACKFTIVKTGITGPWGNAMAANKEIIADIAADTAAPTVAITANTTGSVTLKFNKPVQGAGTAANYAIVKSDGTAVTGIAAAVDGSNTIATVTFASQAQAGGTFNITISNIKDYTLPTNIAMAATTLSFTVSDTVAPAVTSAVYYDGATAYFMVTYNEAMAVAGLGSIIDARNYEINFGTIGTITAINGNKTAKITVTSPVVVVRTAFVYSVADVAGNRLVTAPAIRAEITPITVSAVPTIAGITTLAPNSMKITLQGNVAGLTAASFTATVGGVANNPVAISFVWVGATTEVTATLANATIAATPQAIVVTLVGTLTDTLTGLALAQNPTAPVTDGIKPTMTSVVGGAGNIAITFNEDIDVVNVIPYPFDLVITRTSDSHIMLPSVEYFIGSVVGGTVNVTIAAGTYKVKSAATILYIKDVPVGNLANPFTTETTVTVVAAP